jgi:integrase/recombinase XerC
VVAFDHEAPLVRRGRVGHAVASSKRRIGTNVVRGGCEGEDTGEERSAAVAQLPEPTNGLHPVSTAELVRGREARAALPARLTIAAGQQHTAETILRASREGKSDNTIRSYEHDLEDFSLYLSRALGISPILSVNDALSRLFKQSSPSAHEIVLGFRHHLMAANLAPASASINRHIVALRSVSKLARMLGLMPWFLEAPGVKAEKRRDTRGPTIADVRRMLDATSGDSEGETRNYAIIVTFVCGGLRVSELCGLNLEDLDVARGTTWIKGKGRREKELIALPQLVTDAIAKYLRRRGGTARGPLFLTRSGRISAEGNHRLQTRSVLRIVRTLGQQVGIRCWCHSLRHTAITTAIEKGSRRGSASTRFARSPGTRCSRRCLCTATSTTEKPHSGRSPISSPTPSPRDQGRSTRRGNRQRVGLAGLARHRRFRTPRRHLSQHHPDVVEKVFRINRFELDHRMQTRELSPLLVGDFRARHNHDRCVLMLYALAQPKQESRSVDQWHPKIDDDDVRLVQLREAKPVLRTKCHVDGVSDLLQQFCESDHRVDVVIDDENR